MINVAMDGLVFELQIRGGISRVYQEILPRMCGMDSSVLIDLYVSSRLRQELPAHEQIRRHRVWAPQRFLKPERTWRKVRSEVRRYSVGWATGCGRGRVWHSTYYTLPRHWEGTTVVTVPDTIYEDLKEFFPKPADEHIRAQQRRSVQQADVIICISKTTQDAVLRVYGVDEAKTRMIPLAPSDLFRQLTDSELPCRPTSKPFLLYVGKRARYKSFISLLEAYGMWPKRNDIDLVVVGPPWTSRERELIDSFGLGSSILMLRSVNDNRLCALYNQALAYVCTSLYEGFGIPLLEAMACGCPIVASHIPSSIEVAGEFPLYFDPADSESLLTALDTALTEGRDSVRTALGLEHVKQYSWDRTARETLEVYREVSNPD